MPIEKFTARETVRRSVQKKATGMDRKQVAEQTEIARGWEHAESRRIGYVMAQEHMEIYAPQADLTVTRWKRERLQRIAEPEAATTPSVGAAVRRCRVVARRVDGAHSGCATLANFTDTESVEAAVAAVRRENERLGGLYGVRGLCRVVQVVEEDAVTEPPEARLEAFVRETVLPRTHPNSTARRRVLEALGEAGCLCTARAVNSDGDVILCKRKSGHYDPDDLPGFKRGKSDGTPGGWHLAGGSIWSDAGSACSPHTPVPGEVVGR
ncbi:hypothetical protein [Streptomyces sp. NPDC093097]|uniref:hypothetical protein n=1 Tax=Streptomyces sp. NPDC093097 TaxID=3366027 RepID=UPI00380B1588